MSNRTFYWDANIFISHLKGEQIIPGGLEGIDEIEKLVIKREAKVVTSVLTFTEILQSKLSPEKFDIFLKLFGRQNIDAYDVDENIAKLAGEIRNYHNNEGKKVTTPDAIHLATAIHLNVDVLNTFDGSGKKPGIIQFSGNVAGKYRLLIAPPKADQANLFSSLTDGKSKE